MYGGVASVSVRPLPLSQSSTCASSGLFERDSALASGGLGGALAEKQKGGFDDRPFASGWIALVVLIIRIAIREDEWQYAGSLFANRIKPGGVDA